MFYTPSTLTPGSIQAANEKSGGIVFQYFKNFVSIFSHISEKKNVIFIFFKQITYVANISKCYARCGCIYSITHICCIKKTFKKCTNCKPISQSFELILISHILVLTKSDITFSYVSQEFNIRYVKFQRYDEIF